MQTPDSEHLIRKKNKQIHLNEHAPCSELVIRTHLLAAAVDGHDVRRLADVPSIRSGSVSAAGHLVFQKDSLDVVFFC